MLTSGGRAARGPADPGRAPGGDGARYWLAGTMVCVLAWGGPPIPDAIAAPPGPPMPSVIYPSRDPETRSPDRVPVIEEQVPVRTAAADAPSISYRYVAGVWGHWDHDRRFHPVPAAIAHALEERRRRGVIGGDGVSPSARAETPRTVAAHQGNGLPNAPRGGIVPVSPIPREHPLPR